MLIFGKTGSNSFRYDLLNVIGAVEPQRTQRTQSEISVLAWSGRRALAGFVIRISSFLRISSFVIRHLDMGMAVPCSAAKPISVNEWSLAVSWFLVFSHGLDHRTRPR